MKECEIKEMKKRKDYESAETEAIAQAKVKEEEEENVPTDSLDNIPAVINSEDRVHQYLLTLPVNPVHSMLLSIAPQIKHWSPLLMLRAQLLPQLNLIRAQIPL